MKKLLSWGGVALLTTGLLDPLVYSMLDKPVPWLRDLLMASGGIACFYVMVKFRHYL